MSSLRMGYPRRGHTLRPRLLPGPSWTGGAPKDDGGPLSGYRLTMEQVP